MHLVPFQPDPGLFEELLHHNQIGYGPLGKYRSSGLQSGSGLADFFRTLFSRVSKFAAPLVRSAIPHAKAAFESAKPHLNQAAQTVVSNASEQIAKKIGQVFEPPKATEPVTSSEATAQVGTGLKRKRRTSSKKAPTRKTKRVRRRKRPGPYDYPDIF